MIFRRHSRDSCIQSLVLSYNLKARAMGRVGTRGAWGRGLGFNNRAKCFPKTVRLVSPSVCQSAVARVPR